jgi:Domain of unknown function (DUF6438)
MRNTLLSVFAFLLLSFSSLVTNAQSLLQSGEIPTDLKVTLERTICFGNCVPYKLSIDSEGKVIFEGFDKTKSEVTAEGKITHQQVKELIKEFEKADFFELKDSYQDEKDGCTWLVTDHPSEIISIQINGKTKKINHYFGCGAGTPTKILGELGSKIDEIVETKRWIGEREF